MGATNLESFLRRLSRLSDGAPVDFDLSVKYRSDPDEYWGWLPPVGDYYTAIGIKDPGLGSGPVNFADIEYVILHAAHHRKSTSSAYASAFAQSAEKHLRSAHR
jgi:hypothetical protein